MKKSNLLIALLYIMFLAAHSPLVAENRETYPGERVEKEGQTVLLWDTTYTKTPTAMPTAPNPPSAGGDSTSSFDESQVSVIIDQRHKDKEGN